MKRISFITLLLPSTVLTISFKNDSSSSGGQVIASMYNAWNGKWYQNIAFEQEAIFYKDGQETRKEIWQEVLNSPGNLHIRFNGFETENGSIYTRDSVYSFQAGVLKAKRKDTNFLQLLGFDIYFYKPEVTAQKLKELGYDLSKSYQRSFNKAKLVVVGSSSAADSTSSQFWVDTKRNVVLRAILKNQQGAVRDVAFNNYQLIEGNWVATEMSFSNGKEVVFFERYFNIRFPKTVAAELFDPALFKTAKW